MRDRFYVVLCVFTYELYVCRAHCDRPRSMHSHASTYVVVVLLEEDSLRRNQYVFCK